MKYLFRFILITAAVLMTVIPIHADMGGSSPYVNGGAYESGSAAESSYQIAGAAKEAAESESAQAEAAEEMTVNISTAVIVILTLLSITLIVILLILRKRGCDI